MHFSFLYHHAGKIKLLSNSPLGKTNKRIEVFSVEGTIRGSRYALSIGPDSVSSALQLLQVAELVNNL